MDCSKLESKLAATFFAFSDGSPLRFFDEGNLVVLANGFQKKTDKTPKQELERAERLKQAYYDEKPSQ